MKFSTVFRTGLALTGLLLLTLGSQAQQADAPQETAAATPPLSAAQEVNQQNARSILQRTNTGSKTNKTSHVDATLDMSAGNMGALSFRISAYQVNEKSRMEMVPVGQGVGEFGKKAAQLRFMNISDGKTEWSLAGDTYTKKPAEKDSPSKAANSFMFFEDLSQTFCELLPPITLNGHPVYVIRLTPNDKESPMTGTAYIDQDTYQLRKAEIKFQGAESDQQLLMTVNILKMTANPTIPADLFKFTPPQGAKEAKELTAVGSNPLQVAMSGLGAATTPKAK